MSSRVPDAAVAESADRGSAAPQPPFRPYLLLTVVGALPLLVLAWFAYFVSAAAVERLVRSANDAAATITAALAEREAELWISSLISYARLPVLSAAVAAGDVDEVRRRLEIFVEAYPRLDRAFVSDVSGLLWADYPIAPESLGENFSHRDWFRGVTASQSTYISEIYRRAAEPQLLVIAVASPVHDPISEEVIGFIVAQVRLGELTELLRGVTVGEDGIVFLLDHNGVVVAHPSMDVESEGFFRGYERISDSLPADPGSGDLRGRYVDPFSGDAVLASAVSARIGGHRWTAVSEQPISTAFAATRTLAWQLSAAGLLMAMLVGGLVWRLERENGRRRRAEHALTALNRDLERRVEERTKALRQKEEEFLQAQKMEAIGRLAGGIAHDFNNLLTVILCSTELLLEQLPRDADARDEVKEVHEAAHMAAGLTRQLLAFSRKQVMRPAVLDLNEVIGRMRGIVDRVVGENVDVAWRLSDGLHHVKFDPGQVEQVLMNLVVNACDAMPSGGKLTIETHNVELDEPYVARHPEALVGPHVLLAVTDTGSGIDAETIDKIFEPFYTTKQMGRGTGLGLSTVYGIIRQGDGNILVYSEPGRGTTFKIYLPVVEGAPSGEFRMLPRVEARRGSVLVVEDEAAIRRLLVRTLAEVGYDVLEAADAESARAVIGERKRPVDLLLSDVVLPGMSGPELAAALAEGGTKVLFMSGYADEALLHHGVLEEGTAFLQKPFTMRDLLRKVGDVLSQE